MGIVVSQAAVIPAVEVDGESTGLSCAFLRGDREGHRNGDIADRDAKRDQTRGFAHDETADVAGPGAERHAHAELVAALLDEVGQHTVDTKKR